MARATLSAADKNTLRRIMKKVRAIKIQKLRGAKRSK
jgi:hypothetical protein